MVLTLIDLFSGCGGITTGFENKGFSTLAAVEWDSTIAATYRKNHPNVILFENDIREVNPSEIMTQLHLHQGDLSVLSACAPCQPFSRQNKSKKEDSRTELILEVLPFVDVFKPSYVIMENVPGLNKGKNRIIVDQLITSLRNDFHYCVSGPFVVDAVNYGVPQFRKRLVILCSREGIQMVPPPPTHASPKEVARTGKEKWQTVGDAFQGIHRLASGQRSKSDPMHKARKHNSLNIERLRHIPKNGGSRKDLPERLQLACHKDTVGFNDVYGRMDFRKPSNTLTTGCTNITKGRYAHPTANRAITLREAARLQTFPDTYKFVGTFDQVSTQIGNAVPIKLAEVLAGYLRTLLIEQT